MKKRVIIVTGTRADYGILYPIIKQLNDSPEFDVQLIVTGMHLSPYFGNTINEIIGDGLAICGEVDMLLHGSTHANMAKSIGIAILGMTDILKSQNPDFLVVLGDRGEMLAATIAAAHLNIAIAHIHGGEVSGSIDESVRHAISKFAHIHFTSTRKSTSRLIKMGEKPENIYTVGAPRLDTILNTSIQDLTVVSKKYSLNIEEKKYYLFIYHPVSTDIESNESQLEKILIELKITNEKVVIVSPNSDAGNTEIRNVYKKYIHERNFLFVENFESDDYLTVLKYCKSLIGNSSSGIIEAASFKIPVVNIGNRQNGRERSQNIIDINLNVQEFKEALYLIDDENYLKRIQQYSNIYGDGTASAKICNILKDYDTTEHLLKKKITY